MSGAGRWACLLVMGLLCLAEPEAGAQEASGVEQVEQLVSRKSAKITPARRGNFWGRVQRGEQETELLHALRRAFWGQAEAHDALLIRSALVEHARGRNPRDALVRALLFHFRFELAEEGQVSLTAHNQQALLEMLVIPSLSPELRAWLHWDAGRFALASGRLSEADEFLEDAVRLSLDEELQERLLLLQMLLALQRGEPRKLAALSRALPERVQDRLVRAMSMRCEGWAALFNGEEETAQRLFQRASQQELEAAQASGRSAWTGMPLHPIWKEALVLLQLGTGSDLEGEKQEALHWRLERLRSDLGEHAAQPVWSVYFAWWEKREPAEP